MTYGKLVSVALDFSVGKVGMDLITSSSSIVGGIRLLNKKSLKCNLILSKVADRYEPLSIALHYTPGTRKAKEFAKGHSEQQNKSERN